MKKRSFLLIEVLIAFLLIAICAVPLVKYPLQFYRTEMKQLEKMELERLADWSFSEVKEKLLKGEIPWEQIPKKGETSGPFELPPSTLQIPHCSAKQVKRSFSLRGRGEKEGVQKQVFRQLGVEITLNGTVYTFRIPVQKILVE